MAKRNYLAVVAAPIVILVSVISLMSMGLLEESGKVENVKIEISYSGTWEGVIYNNEQAQRVSGFTKKTIIVFRPSADEWNLAFTAEKKDDTTNQLKVKIVTIEGDVLEQAQTVEPFGKISISIEII
ncbi:MAG: hypothetical protein PVH79_02900 [Candidatus Bathyarchaeota archaeon]